MSQKILVWSWNTSIIPVVSVLVCSSSNRLVLKHRKLNVKLWLKFQLHPTSIIQHINIYQSLYRQHTYSGSKLRSKWTNTSLKKSLLLQTLLIISVWSFTRSSISTIFMSVYLHVVNSNYVYLHVVTSNKISMKEAGAGVKLLPYFVNILQHCLTVHGT